MRHDICFNLCIGKMVQFKHGRADGIAPVRLTDPVGGVPRFKITMLDRKQDYSIFELYFTENDVTRCEMGDHDDIYITIAV